MYKFKGTGNMELVLDRRLAERRVFPAIDIYKSGTRKEELILTEEELEAAVALRKQFGQRQLIEVIDEIKTLMKNTRDNEQFVQVVRKTLQD